MKPADALSETFPLRITHKSGLWIPSKIGFAGRIALRSLTRRRSQTIQALACVSTILALMTLSILGGHVAKETTQKYVEEAMGRNVILIAEPEMAEQYLNLLSKFYESTRVPEINYLDQKYIIPDFVISNLSAIGGITKIDARIVFETTIYEYPHIAIDPENPQSPYTVIGDHRICRVILIVVNPNQIVNDWFIPLGRTLEETDANNAIVGDFAASKTFTNPLKQSFKMLDNDIEFTIVGICVDPLNNGAVVYIPLFNLYSITGKTYPNLLLLQINPSDRTETLERIETISKESGLEIIDLNEILDKQISFLDNSWSMALSLSFLSILNAAICLFGYMMLSLMKQRRDLDIMRALGTKPHTIMKIIFLESLSLVLVSSGIGVSIGTAITFTLLIPEATISQMALPKIIGLILLVMCAIFLFSTYPAITMTKETINNTISRH